MDDDDDESCIDPEYDLYIESLIEEAGHQVDLENRIENVWAIILYLFLVILIVWAFLDN